VLCNEKCGVQQLSVRARRDVILWTLQKLPLGPCHIGKRLMKEGPGRTGALELFLG